MTVIPLRTRGRRTRRLVAALGAVVLALGLAAPAAASPSIAQAAPVPEPGETAFTLAPVGNGVVRPGDPLAVSVTLQNETAVATAPVTVTLLLGSLPLSTRAALDEWLAGPQDGVPLTPVGTADLPAVLSGTSEATGIVVAADAPALAGRAPGVYPLVATYVGPDGTVSSTSVMIVPASDAPLTLGLVVPVTTGPRTTALLSADELTELTSETGALTAQLDAIEGTPAILAIDPAILAAIRVLGTAAPEAATLWLARLDALPNARFALQFGDADVSTQLAAGLSRPLAPPRLSSYLSADDFLPDPDATPEPTPTPGVTDELPSNAELLDVGATRDQVYWPAAGSATAETLALLGDLGDDDDIALSLVPSSSTAQGSDGTTVRARGAVADAGVLVYDSTISAALSEASVLDESTLRGAALTAATAHLVLAATDTDGAPLLVAFDRSVDRSRVGLRTAITSAVGAPGVSALSLDALASAPALDVEIGDAGTAPARAAAASTLLAEENELARFATILDDPVLLTGPERAELLQLFGVSWLDAADGEWSAAVAAHREGTVATLTSVRLAPTSTINLYGAGARLWFTVQNDLPYPVNLVLYAVPDDLRLDVQRATQVVATASSNTRVEVPVQARVGNGDVQLQLQLRSRASVAIGPSETVDVNVRAEWETVGVVALSVVVGGLVLLGIIRTVLRVRRRKQGEE
jgi:hypothetical protein